MKVLHQRRVNANTEFTWSSSAKLTYLQTYLAIKSLSFKSSFKKNTQYAFEIVVLSQFHFECVLKIGLKILKQRFQDSNKTSKVIYLTVIYLRHKCLKQRISFNISILGQGYLNCVGILSSNLTKNQVSLPVKFT